MENGPPISSVASVIGHHRTSNTATSNGNNGSFAAAVLAAAAASQHHFFNAAMRAAAASSTAPPPTAGLDHGSGGSNSPLSVQLDYTPETAEAKLIDYRQEKVAAFEIDGETMMCLPQAYEMFLKNLVGGLHTVYTKLKRLEIAPFVCNVEQVRALRSIGAIQPGVNRCKLISCRDFDVLYEDCASSSSRPGRPPKRSPIFATSSIVMPPSNVAASGSSSISNNGFGGGGVVANNVNFGAAVPDFAPAAKRSRVSESSTASALDKFNTTFNPMAGFAAAAAAGGNPLNPNQLFPLFPFVPQNFMLSQFMNANPNASLLAKHWGEQLNVNASNGGLDNMTPVDATTKNEGGHNEELARNISTNADRNASWTSTSGRESEEFMKYSNANGEHHRHNHHHGENLSMPRVSTATNNSGAFDREEENEENGGSSSDFEDVNGRRSSIDEIERKEADKDDDNEQQSPRQWANVSTTTANGGEASQLLRSMVDLGVNGQFFGGPPGLAAAAAAAVAVSQQNGRQRPNSFSQSSNDASHYSSVENILFSVLGLVQVAASTARMHEEQLVKEKLEAMRLYESEKQERVRLEQLLRGERHSRAVYLKRLRKERKQKTELSEKMLVLADEVRKQKTPTINSTLSPIDATFGTKTAKLLQVSHSSRSTSSTEMSPQFFSAKATSTSTTTNPNPIFSISRFSETALDIRQQQRASADGLVDNQKSSISISDNKGGESTTSQQGESAQVLENCSDGARNARGRTATLFIKHELS